MKFSRAVAILLGGLLLNSLVGCATVAVQDQSAENYAKEFNAPPAGWSGLYIYRTCNIMGAALKKSLYVDGQYIGETSRCRFFYRLLTPGVHTLQTESEFSENDLDVNFVEGKNHYIKQYLKLGVFVGGANLEVMDPDTAKKDIEEGQLAQNKDDPVKNLNNRTIRENQGSIPGPQNAQEAAAIAKKQEL